MIGVYTLFAPNLLERFGCSLEEFKKSRIEWGRVYFDSSGNATLEDDLINDLLNENCVTIQEYDNNTGIVQLQFETPVPLDIIKEKFEYYMPVFEDGAFRS